MNHSVRPFTPDQSPARRSHLSIGWSGVSIFAVGAAIRIAVVLLGHNPGESLYSDMANYDRVAQHLSHGYQDVTDAFYPIGYPAFVAPAFLIPGRHYVVVGVAQALLGALTCLIVWRLARRVTGSDRLAFGVSLLTALYPPLIYYSSMLLTEAIAPFFVSLALLLLIEVVARAESARTRVGAGIAVAIATLIRPNLLILYPFVGLLVWIGYRRRSPRPVVAIGQILIAALPLLALASIDNSRLVGRPVGLSTNGGINFFLLQADVRRLQFYDDWIAPVRNTLLYDRVVDSPVPLNDERYFYRAGISQFFARPDKVRHTASEILEGFGLGQQGYWPANRSLPDEEAHADQAALRRLLRWCSRLFFWFMVVPILVESAFLIATRRLMMTEELPALTALSIVVALTATFGLFLADPRVHVPFDPVLLVLSAAAYRRFAVWTGFRVRSGRQERIELRQDVS